ncbi:MAG TPA: hypothetical protein VFR38_11600 [Gaiellaceae bacterium]|nr:hypothetical protein [Gaiellaceae bacterium]
MDAHERIILVLCPFVVGICALHRQRRMFPKGFDPTGWNPDGERAGWFLTKFTWLSGSRGGS